MMLGNVNANREAIIQIAIVGDNKQLKSLRAVIDTGFTGDLTLSRAIIDELGFSLRGIQEVILGDGSLHYFEMCVGSLIWDGQMKRVEINAAETDSLVGMGLLEGYKLEIEGIPGGEVRITFLPALSSASS
jgi:clan AA aspartic protease